MAASGQPKGCLRAALPVFPAERTAVRVGCETAGLLSTADQVPVVEKTVLGNSSLIHIVAVDQSESLCVAEGPFEVVDETPVEVALQIYAVAQRF